MSKQPRAERAGRDGNGVAPGDTLRQERRATVAAARRPADHGLPPSLSRVAAGIAWGLTQREVASILEMPLATVRTYVHRIYTRLGVRNRVELAQCCGAPELPRPRGALPTSLAAVADGIARGLSDKEIAAELALSLATVRTYVRRVYARLEVHGRVELARAWAVTERSWRPPERVERTSP